MKINKIRLFLSIFLTIKLKSKHISGNKQLNTFEVDVFSLTKFP